MQEDGACEREALGVLVADGGDAVVDDARPRGGEFCHEASLRLPRCGARRPAARCDVLLNLWDGPRRSRAARSALVRRLPGQPSCELIRSLLLPGSLFCARSASPHASRVPERNHGVTSRLRSTRRSRTCRWWTDRARLRRWHLLESRTVQAGGDACRAACEAAFERAMVVCSRKPTPRQREACTREAMAVLAACVARCPDGERGCRDGRSLDHERDECMTSEWTTSLPSES